MCDVMYCQRAAVFQAAFFQLDPQQMLVILCDWHCCHFEVADQILVNHAVGNLLKRSTPYPIKASSNGS